MYFWILHCSVDCLLLTSEYAGVTQHTYGAHAAKLLQARDVGQTACLPGPPGARLTATAVWLVIFSPYEVRCIHEHKFCARFESFTQRPQLACKFLKARLQLRRLLLMATWQSANLLCHSAGTHESTVFSACEMREQSLQAHHKTRL